MAQPQHLLEIGMVQLEALASCKKIVYTGRVAEPTMLRVATFHQYLIKTPRNIPRRFFIGITCPETGLEETVRTFCVEPASDVVVRLNACIGTFL